MFAICHLFYRGFEKEKKKAKKARICARMHLRARGNVQFHLKGLPISRYAVAPLCGCKAWHVRQTLLPHRGAAYTALRMELISYERT